MRLLIHAPAARMGGARSHLLGIVPELARLAPEDAVLLLAQPDLLAELPPLPASWTLRAERAQARSLLARLAWEQAALPRIAARWRADVLLSFGSFVPLRAGLPTVVEAGNALPFTRAFWYAVRDQPARAQLGELARWLLLCASLRSAARVLVPTRAMRQDVLTALPRLIDRIDVAWWGVAPIFHQQRWRRPAAPTVVGVSKHGINKEFDVLIEAVAQLRHDRPDLQLVLTGTPDESRWSARSARLASELGIRERVHFAGDVPNTQIPALLCQAQLLVFPTWCESFGLPLAEALALGAPAVAADIPACREVGGDAARFYAPGDATSLAGAIGELLRHAAAAEALAAIARERGQRFQWRDNARLVRQSLCRAMGAGA